MRRMTRTLTPVVAGVVVAALGLVMGPAPFGGTATLSCSPDGQRVAVDERARAIGLGVEPPERRFLHDGVVLRGGRAAEQRRGRRNPRRAVERLVLGRRAERQRPRHERRQPRVRVLRRTVVLHGGGVVRPGSGGRDLERDGVDAGHAGDPVQRHGRRRALVSLVRLDDRVRDPRNGVQREHTGGLRQPVERDGVVAGVGRDPERIRRPAVDRSDGDGLRGDDFVHRRRDHQCRQRDGDAIQRAVERILVVPGHGRHADRRCGDRQLPGLRLVCRCLVL